MRHRGSCVLYTTDAPLSQRLKAFLQSMVDVHEVESATAAERLLQQLEPTLLLADTRARDSEGLLVHLRDAWPRSVAIALGVPRSDPMRVAQLIGVFACEDCEAERQHIQAHVGRALEHLHLQEENRWLKETGHTGPARSPGAAPSSAANPAARVALAHFSKAIRKFENVDALLGSLAEAIADALMVSRVGIFSRTTSGDAFRLRAGLRCMPDTGERVYAEGETLVHWLDIHAHMVTRANLEHIADAGERRMLKQALDTLGAEVIVPMHARGRVLGWVFSGQRATGIPFRQEELEDLVSVTDHAATTLENALLYEAVAVQKTLAETLLQTMPTGIVAVGPEGKVEWFNRAAQLVFEKPEEQAMNQPAEALGSQVADLLRRTLADEASEEPREWKAPDSGRSLSAQAHRLMHDDQCLGAVALIQDLTGERALQEKEEQLERATFWTELAASMSHEVRNPLVAIKTFAQLLPDHYEDPEFRGQFSELVSKEVDRLNKIIEQINDFAHPPELDFSTVDMGATVRKSLDMVSLRIPKNGVDIDTKVNTNLPPVHGDEHALAECFAQLIANAMEASSKRKKPKVAVSVESSKPSNGTPAGISVTIQDNGTGMAGEVQEKMFSPFCTTKARGLGLGLPIVRRTVVDHNGRVEVATGKRGTAVTVTLPAENGNGNGAS